MVAGLLGLLVAILLIVILVRTWKARSQLSAYGKALSDTQLKSLNQRGVDTNIDSNTGLFGLTGNVVLFSLFGAIPMLIYSIAGITSGIAIKGTGRHVTARQ